MVCALCGCVTEQSRKCSFRSMPESVEFIDADARYRCVRKGSVFSYWLNGVDVDKRPENRWNFQHKECSDSGCLMCMPDKRRDAWLTMDNDGAVTLRIDCRGRVIVQDPIEFRRVVK